MLPSLTLHRAVNVAVIATLTATMVLMREPPAFSTASEMVSAISLMAADATTRRRPRDACDSVEGRGIASSPPPPCRDRRLRRRRIRASARSCKGDIASCPRSPPGAMGVVYRGERVQLGRPVAVKFLHPWIAAQKTFLSRFENEARAMSRLGHPQLRVGDRLRRRGRPVPGDGLRDREDPARRDPRAGAAAASARAAHRAAAAGRAGARARAGDRSPRSQARQPDPHRRGGPGRSPAHPGFRAGQAARRAGDDRGHGGRARPATCRPSRAAPPAPSTRAATSTRSACCCSSCSPGASRSRRSRSAS